MFWIYAGKSGVTSELVCVTIVNEILTAIFIFIASDLLKNETIFSTLLESNLVD